MNQSYKLLLLSFLSFLIVFTSLSQTIIRGPYLQKGTATSVVVKWRTDINVSTIIEYGINESYSSTFNESTPKTEHALEITGLSPNTKYHYRIGNNGSLLGGSIDLYFKTHPDIGTSGNYRFWVLGDCGTGDGNAMAVRDSYYNDYSGSDDTNAILFLGDNAYPDGTDTEYQTAVFDMYQDKLKNTIAWSCLGNHDGEFNANVYYDIFTFPTSGESGGMASGTESFYSFDYGNIHFIMLNSFDEDRTVGSSMYNWAENDIQNTTQKWIVALWHHPPYTKGSHDSDNGGSNTSGFDIELIQMRENFLPMLEANGVDLVLAGHSHSYERSYLLNGHYELSDTFDLSTHTIGDTGDGDGKINGDGAYSKTTSGNNAGLGAVYVVTGSAGKISGGSLNHNAMYYSVNELGSSILEFDGNNLTVKFLRDNGSIEDIFTIQKEPTLSLENNEIDGLQIYSTASPSNLYVKGKLLDTTIMNLYDLQGRLVLKTYLDIMSNSNKIYVDYLSTGIYLVKLNIGRLIKIQKVIIR